MKPARFEQEASEEVEVAEFNYERQRRGLGSEFLIAVGDELEQIEQAPQRFPFYAEDEGVRYAVIRRFPYVLVFQEFDAEIRVLRCAHERKEPMFTGGRRRS